MTLMGELNGLMAESGSHSLAGYFQGVASSTQDIEASSFVRQAKFAILGISSTIFSGGVSFLLYWYTTVLQRVFFA